MYYCLYIQGFKYDLLCSSTFILGLPDAVAFYPLTVNYGGYDVGPNKNPPGKLNNVRPAPGPDGRRSGSYSFFGSIIEFPNTWKLGTQNSVTLLAWVNPKGGAVLSSTTIPRGLKSTFG